MSLNSYATPLMFDPRPSTWLLVYLVVSHIISLIVLLPLAIPASVKMLLATLILGSLLGSLRRHALLVDGRAIVRVCWGDDGWELEMADRSMLKTTLLPDSYVSTFCVVLGFRGRRFWQHRYLVLAPDSLDADTLRRLRVRLRLEGGRQAG